MAVLILAIMIFMSPLAQIPYKYMSVEKERKLKHLSST